ncbi:MAG TPA: UDP-glucose--hexose-1-phosphate uridylyltransferase [Pyrinomonadaceae bacterium]|nr:UDP-glucose--hexose-1-phosphate uridylyltransferase [Pyrinomonadaceae bacterium]
MLDLKKHTHRRYNLLTREWILVSPHRTDRPWQGQVEKTDRIELPQYDPTCYLCPGNERAGGVRNPKYESTFVFDNDFPAMLPDTPSDGFAKDGLLMAEGEPGICRVACFSPRHDLTIADMELSDIRTVIDVWTEQYNDLGSMTLIDHVQIFENRGAMMGASNPHPHCQIWANSTVPNEVVRELASFDEYLQKHEACLLCNYVALEAGENERVVVENIDFAAIVPFWAVWPFEILIVAKRHVTALDGLSDNEKNSLADILKAVTSRYDKLFDTPFPYTMGFHQRPTDGKEHFEFHFHAHFYPPLLRSAAVRKFMVGYEMLASPQRDITAELAAQRLRDIV